MKHTSSSVLQLLTVRLMSCGTFQLETQIRPWLLKTSRPSSPAVQSNSCVSSAQVTHHRQVSVGVCAFQLPLRELPDLGYAHVLVEMFEHVDHSLQQVGHLTVLPLSGHGSGARHTNECYTLKATSVQL